MSQDGVNDGGPSKDQQRQWSELEAEIYGTGPASQPEPAQDPVTFAEPPVAPGVEPIRAPGELYTPPTAGAFYQPPTTQPSFPAPLSQPPAGYGSSGYGVAPGYGQPNPYYVAPGYGYQPTLREHPQSATALALGVAGIFFGICAPIAWAIGAKVERDVRNGAPFSVGGNAKTGKVLGIVFTLLNALFWAFVIMGSMF